MTAPAPTPGFGDVIRLPQPGGWDAVPDTANPYYFAAHEGLFLHKRMLIGRGASKVKQMPGHLPQLGWQDGIFHFDAEPIPARLMGQVVNFFERIYDRQHTEAAVLLTMHRETKEWRIFVPTQLVSHGGVNYVFDPAHIRDPWIIVGSIHSHCDFGAGHSSTDTGDAADFDGLHCTIGMIKRPVPQIVAMVAMNGQLYHYKEDLFDKLFDFNEAKQHEAPAWWDRYVEDTKQKIQPVGFELYKRFDRPTVVKHESKGTITRVGQPSTGYRPSGFMSDDWYYSAAAKRMVHKSWDVDEHGNVTYPLNQPAKGQHGVTKFRGGRGSEDRFTRSEQGITRLGAEYDPQKMRELGYVWDTGLNSWRWRGHGSSYDGGSQPLNESKAFNARQTAERGRANWGADGELYTIEELDEIDEILGTQGDTFWEDELPRELVDLFMDSNMITDEDLDEIVRDATAYADLASWRTLFLTKAVKASQILRELGLDVTFRVKTKGEPEQPKLLPEPANPQPTQHGAN